MLVIGVPYISLQLVMLVISVPYISLQLGMLVISVLTFHCN